MKNLVPLHALILVLAAGCASAPVYNPVPVTKVVTLPAPAPVYAPAPVTAVTNYTVVNHSTNTIVLTSYFKDVPATKAYVPPPQDPVMPTATPTYLIPPTTTTYVYENPVYDYTYFGRYPSYGYGYGYTPYSYRSYGHTSYGHSYPYRYTHPYGYGRSSSVSFGVSAGVSARVSIGGRSHAPAHIAPRAPARHR